MYGGHSEFLFAVCSGGGSSWKRKYCLVLLFAFGIFSSRTFGGLICMAVFTHFLISSVGLYIISSLVVWFSSGCSCGSLWIKWKILSTVACNWVHIVGMQMAVADAMWLVQWAMQYGWGLNTQSNIYSHRRYEWQNLRSPQLSNAC